MTLYAAQPLRRSLQILADLLVLAWVWLWVTLAGIVHDATLALAVPGREIESAGNGLADRLRDAGATVGEVPFIGDDVRSPFDQAGGAADRIAEAGASQVAAVEELAFWLGLVVGVLPTVGVVLVWLLLRVRFVRRAGAVSRVAARPDGADLLALRALARQPLGRLATVGDTVGDGVVGGWERRDPAVVEALARLERRRAGIS